MGESVEPAGLFGGMRINKGRSMNWENGMLTSCGKTKTEFRSWCLGIMAVAVLPSGMACATDKVFEVKPAAEIQPTTPVQDADDACIWIHPTDPSLSTVVGSDKEGQAWIVYDLAGREIQHVKMGPVNNVDLRYDFPLGGRKVALVTGKLAGEPIDGGPRKEQLIVMYMVDPETRKLLDVTGEPIKTGMEFAYGSCMYRSARTGKYYVIVNSYEGHVEQYVLFDDGQGKVRGKLVLSLIHI